MGFCEHRRVERDDEQRPPTGVSDRAKADGHPEQSETDHEDRMGTTTRHGMTTRAITACTTRRCTSTASSRGWTSTSACCSSARTSRTPLLERVKFCAIYTTNLDEYYMVRVAGLHDQIDAGVENPSQDGLHAVRDDRGHPRARARARGAPQRLL